MNFSERIINLMFERKIKNMRELSKLSGVPVSTLIKIKKNGGGTTELPILIKLADFFNVTIDDLIGMEVSELNLQNSNIEKVYH